MSSSSWLCTSISLSPDICDVPPTKSGGVRFACARQVNYLEREYEGTHDLGPNPIPGCEKPTGVVRALACCALSIVHAIRSFNVSIDLLRDLHLGCDEGGMGALHTPLGVGERTACASARSFDSASDSGPFFHAYTRQPRVHARIGYFLHPFLPRSCRYVFFILAMHVDLAIARHLRRTSDRKRRASVVR